MPARVTRTSHKLGYREVVYNVKKQKFYTDANGDQFEQIAIPGVTDSVSQEDIDNAIANIDAVTQSELDAAVSDKVTDTELNTAVSDKVTQAQVDASITAAADSIVPLATANSQGYFFQNSHYFSDGLNHNTNPDVTTDVEAGAETIVKFSDTTAGESGGFLQADLQGATATDISHMYDTSTGIITLKGVQPAQFILIRIQIDIEPDSDNSAADLILRCTANAASGGFTFDIQEQLASLDQGADIEYPTNVSVPIFIGNTLSEDPSGSPATIQPIVKLTNTSGDVKPRALAIFFWS